MLLIVAFALFILLIAAWIGAPTTSEARPQEASSPAGMPAMGTHSA